MSGISPGAAFAPSPRWRAPVQGLAWRQWDDECVVYLEAQATTHGLDAASSAVFMTLCEADRALSIDEIAAQAFGTPSATDAQEPPDAIAPDEFEALRAILAELERIGVAQLQTP